jgi:hypothetical protein
MTPVWLVFWLLVLGGTTLLLLEQLVGVDIIRVHQGELAITRRAGPVARTWRYSTGMITNLRIDISRWDGDGADGASMFLIRSNNGGGVRFDYGAETIHLAPHVDAPEAAKIADWLRRRLPVSAVS